MTMRHLDGTGKGEAKYDYSNDILLLKIKDRDYKKSIELDNLVVDFDSEDFIYGMRIFDASKVLELPKESLPFCVIDVAAAILDAPVTIFPIRIEEEASAGDAAPLVTSV